MNLKVIRAVDVCRYFGLKRSAAQKQQKTINASAKVDRRCFSYWFYRTWPVVKVVVAVCILCGLPLLDSHATASSCAEWSLDKPPASFVNGPELTMWDIVCASPQAHRSESACHHLFWQAPQWPCTVRKRFRRDHCRRARSKLGCRIVPSTTKRELTTEGKIQSCLYCKGSDRVWEQRSYEMLAEYSSFPS